jgi:predicted MFS family arabinose efflux permease
MGTGRHLRTAATLLLLSILVMGIGYPLLSAGLGTLLHAPAYPAAPSTAPTSNNSTANATLAVGTAEGGPISEPVLGPTTANMMAAAPPPGPARGGP